MSALQIQRVMGFGSYETVRSMCHKIRNALIAPGIQSRESEGTQTPIETLDRGWGSCRHLAVLLIEAARTLGFGARVVTGYVYNPAADGHQPPRWASERRIHGPTSMSRAPDGLPMTPRTERSAATI